MRRAISFLVVTALVLPAGVVTAQTDILNAAPNTTAVTTTSTNLGQYEEVQCSTNPLFAENSCDQCFMGEKVKVNESITDLFDNWNNTSQNVHVAYKDEQKIPNMVSVGSKWVPVASDGSKMWKYSPQVVWIPGSDGRSDSVTLASGQKIRFIETDLGGGYTLESSDKNNGDVVGLLRFPIVYHVNDITTGNIGEETKTHTECVAYTLDKPKTPPTTPSKPDKPKTPPTTPETGPAETLLLIIAAFFIAFGLMISLRKRS